MQKRPFAVVVLLLVVAVAALAMLRHRAGGQFIASVPDDNPGHFVPSDVSRLASTGRPQLVEVFHYG